MQRPAGVRTDSLGPPKLVTVKGKVATCWLVDRRRSKRGETAPATSTEASVDQGCEGPTPQPDRPQPDLRQSIRLMQSTTQAARLPVSRPAWMTYCIGLPMARAGYLTLASSRPSQLARFLSSHMTLVVEIYKGTAGTGHFRILTTTA